MNQGRDLIAGQGMAAALEASKTSPLQWGSFASLTGGRSAYKTTGEAPGEVDFNGISFMGGVSKHIPMETGDVMLGVYFEMGDGSIETHNQ